MDLFEIHVPVAELMLRGTLVYWLLFLIFRFILRRDVGAVGIADILLLVIVADAAQNAMSGGYDTFSEGAVLVLTTAAVLASCSSSDKKSATAAGVAPTTSTTTSPVAAPTSPPDGSADAPRRHPSSFEEGRNVQRMNDTRILPALSRRGAREGGRGRWAAPGATDSAADAPKRATEQDIATVS